MGSTKHLHFASSRDGATKTLKQERQSVLIKALILAFSIIFAFAFTFGESAGAIKAYAFEGGDVSLQAASLSAESLSAAKAFNPKISKKSLKLKYNKSTTLKVTGNDGKKVTWSSSNKKAVQVKSTGAAKAKVTAKGNGSATITAKVGAKRLKCKVTIPFNPKISKSTTSLAYGTSMTLKITANNGQKVTWASSNKNVIQVKSTGTAKAKVTAKGNGSATITAKVGGKKLKCKVSIPFNPKISESSASLAYETSMTLKVTGNNGQKVTWTSSNEDAVQVESTGVAKAKVTAKGIGSATITAKVGGKNLKCKVEIPFYPKINMSSASLVYGESTALKVTANNGQKVTWTSNDENVAVVEPTGTTEATVTAKGAGTTTVTAKVGGKELICTVTVVGKLSATNIEMTAFDCRQLKLIGADVESWRSSDVERVVVSENGELTSGGFAGTATITCTDTEGNQYECVVSMSMPDVECKMLGTTTQKLTTTWYFKRFRMSNWSGKTITLDYSYMTYYPYGGNDIKDNMAAGDSIDNLELFNDHPVTLKSGYSYSFVALEGEVADYYPAYSDRYFFMSFTADGAIYTCGFSTDGKMIACRPFRSV